MDPTQGDTACIELSSLNTKRSYGDTIIESGAQAQLGDILHDVKVTGNITGGLHLHLNAQSHELSAVSAVYSLIQIAEDLTRFGERHGQHGENPDRSDAIELQELIKRLETCLSQFKSVHPISPNANLPSSEEVRNHLLSLNHAC